MSRTSSPIRQPAARAPWYEQEAGRLWVLLLALLIAVAGPALLARAAHASPSPVVTASTSSPDAATRGQWTAKEDDHPGTIWIGFQTTLPHGGWHQNWDRVSIAQLKGVSAQVIEGPTSAVAFDLQRDAGTLHCHGEFSGGMGAGLFEVALDPRYADRLEKRGVGRPTPDQQVQLAMADAGFDLLDQLAADHYPTPTIDLFLKMAVHGVDVDYVKGMSKLGYNLGSVSELVKARDHGVDPNFIGSMADAGYSKLDFQTLLRARDHGADSDYISGMADVGFNKLPLEQLITARDHGVDPMYVEQMQRAGFPDLPLSLLIRARDHGVSPSFARRVKGNRPDASMEEIISMRDRGVRD
jgi:hypothetical protein